MGYEEAIEYLYNARPPFHIVGGAAYKPGLDNIKALLAELGNPEAGMKCVHVAGTNGKGSTSHLIAAALQAAGYKVGLYTSPHLVDYRERVRVNGRMVEKEYVADWVSRWQAVLDRLQPFGITYFRIILVATHVANILFHIRLYLNELIMFLLSYNELCSPLHLQR